LKKSQKNERTFRAFRKALTGGGLMDLELHFPKELAQDYLECSPSYNIFDSPFIEDIDVRVGFHVVPAFRFVYKRFRDRFRRKKIPDDIKVFHYDESDNKVYYDVECVLRKYSHIERLIFTHAVLTYRHPISEFLAGYNIPDDLDFDLYNAIDRAVKQLEVGFSLTGTASDPVILVTVPANLFPIAVNNKDIVPLSATNQLVYSMSRFMAESGLLPENQASYLEFECEVYEKNVKKALELAKKEIDQIVKGDKLRGLVKLLWEKRYIRIQGNAEKFWVGIDLDAIGVIDSFNQEHETEFTSDDVLKAVNRFVRTKKIICVDDEWRLNL
jgi:hypothetical protein